MSQEFLKSVVKKIIISALICLSNYAAFVIGHSTYKPKVVENVIIKRVVQQGFLRRATVVFHDQAEAHDVDFDRCSIKVEKNASVFWKNVEFGFATRIGDYAGYESTSTNRRKP